MQKNSFKYSFSDYLFESECRPLQEFIKEYGREVVYEKSMTFKMSQKDLEKIYKILNETFLTTSFQKTFH